MKFMHTAQYKRTFLLRNNLSSSGETAIFALNEPTCMDGAGRCNMRISVNSRKNRRAPVRILQNYMSDHNFCCDRTDIINIQTFT
jgi:hypothetical protein